MPNVVTDAHIMSMRLRRYVSSSIGSFRDRSRSRNRRRTYSVNAPASRRASDASSQSEQTYQTTKRRSQIVDVGFLF